MTEAERKTQEIKSQRNTVSADFGSGLAGITVRDNHLRTVSVKLTIEAIDKLIDELQIARSHLEFEELIYKVSARKR
jgi:hypothetical protein